MNTQDLGQIRFLYREGVNHEEHARKLWEIMEHYEGEEGIMWAYKASARALMANYDWNPIQQLWYINECMKWFRKGVKRDPDNIEIRFLRFAVQHYTPEFLNQSHNLEEDKATMLANFDQYKRFGLEVADLHDFIRFYQESARFSEEEMAHLKTHLGE
ncbi:MAG: hypothetical protein AAF135_25750 [Bacteroidota bacterium]